MSYYSVSFTDKKLKKYLITSLTNNCINTVILRYDKNIFCFEKFNFDRSFTY